MADRPRLTRESFLKLSAMTAVGTMLGAVDRVATPALQAQATYNEAPSLAAKVAAGQLPPVGERLPQNPYIPPHKWLGVGKYGGTLRLSLREPSDIENGRRIANYMYGHSPVRWLRDGLEIGPGLVERWETNADASSWTFYFRSGSESSIDTGGKFGYYHTGTPATCCRKARVRSRTRGAFAVSQGSRLPGDAHARPHHPVAPALRSHR